ncbi:MAG: hypothetical protein K2W84_09250 [Burkholderiales bacterium]|nr:hypothetical protein [Burkholderiales bacterium]
MATMVDYYKYATLSTAAYVRMANEPLSGQRFAEVAASETQARLPLKLGEKLFIGGAENLDAWTILNYYRNDRTGDAIASADKSGLGAILFTRGSGENAETVLAITGTESTNFKEITSDLVSSDLGQIGLLGIALTQAIAAVNLIERMRAISSADVQQIRFQTSLTRPATGEYLNNIWGQVFHYHIVPNCSAS